MSWNMLVMKQLIIEINIDAIDKETLDKLVNVLPVIEKATINAGSIDVNGIVKSMVKDREEKENNVVSIDDRKEE